jgi:hypothetical protein
LARESESNAEGWGVFGVIAVGTIVVFAIVLAPETGGASLAGAAAL